MLDIYIYICPTYHSLGSLTKLAVCAVQRNVVRYHLYAYDVCVSSGLEKCIRIEMELVSFILVVADLVWPHCHLFQVQARV